MKKLTLTVLSTTLICTTCFASTFNYAIIIDAGSSGSRIHLFQYEANQAIPDVKEIFSENTKPGLSSYAQNPQAAGESLKQLFTDATLELNQRHIDPKTVSLNVFATAGMRLLPVETQQAIYDNVTRYIKTNYPFAINHIQTISGKMEGVYGWLDVNYLAKNFQNHTPTTGSIDMGGASTQIVFVTPDTTKADDEIDITLDKQNYHVFSKSFLGLGQDQSQAEMNKDTAADTCYPLHYNTTHATGNYNFAACSAIYTNMIQQHHVSESLPPLTDQRFVIFSAAYYDYKFFDMIHTPDQTTVEQRIQSICTESWEQLQTDYPKENPQFLANYCANETYLDNLFYNAYQLQGSQMTITRTINNEDIDWAKGALLFQLNEAKHD